MSPDMTSSTYHDLEQANRLEVSRLSSPVIELGHAVGLATSLNRAVADILAIRAGATRIAEA